MQTQKGEKIPNYFDLLQGKSNLSNIYTETKVCRTKKQTDTVLIINQISSGTSDRHLRENCFVETGASVRLGGKEH